MLRVDSTRVSIASAPDGSEGRGAFLVDDHADATTAWLVDPARGIAESAPGVPDFSLLRYQDASAGGGVLSFALRTAPPTEAMLAEVATASGGRRVQPAPIRSFQARIRVRSAETGGGDHVTAWTDGQVAADGAVRFGMTFGGVDMQVLAALIDAAPRPDGASPIEVEGVITIAGLAGAIPAVASIAPRALSAAIRARVASAPAPATDDAASAFIEDALVEAGVLALQEDATTGSWRRRDDRREPLDASTVLHEVARRALAIVATEIGPESPEMPTRWRLLPDDQLQGSADLDLAAYRAAVLRVPVRWSMTDFLAGLSADQRAKALPMIGDVEPLHPVTVHVASTIPFDPRFVTGVDVTLRFRGVTGAFQTQTLRVDTAHAIADASIVHNQFLPFTLDRHLAVMLAAQPGAWGRVRQLPYQTGGRLVVIDAVTADTTFVPAAIDDDVFHAASAVEIVLRGEATSPQGTPPLAKVTFTRDAPSATIAIDGAGRALWATITAVAPVLATPPAPEPPPPDASSSSSSSSSTPSTSSDVPPPARLVIRDGAVSGRIDVASSDLMSPEPIAVTLRRAPDATEARYPYLAVSVRAKGSADAFILLEGGDRAWSVFRADPFAPPAYQYRAEWMLRGDAPPQPGEMSFGAIVTGPWRDAAPPLLIIDPEAESTPSPAPSPTPPTPS